MTALEYRKVDGEELAQWMAGNEGWSVIEGQLAKVFEFKTYKDGLVFATAVGFLADQLDHHPDLLVTYGKVDVRMNTHAVKGLSPYDFELARRIDSLFGGSAA